MLAHQRVEAVRALWREHMQTAFPSRLRATEIGGVEMVLLDADIAGCVSAWLDTSGRLDQRRHALIGQCLRRLDIVLPLLAGHELDYFNQLRDVAALIHDRPATTGESPTAG